MTASLVKAQVLLGDKQYKWKIVWHNVIIMGLLHLIALYSGLYIVPNLSWKTRVFGKTFRLLGGIGITAGAHRLWCHRTYKAKLPVQLILMIMNCMTYVNSIYIWARDHRLHHRYSDTDADPHNSQRGLFFSHIGWLLLRKHQEVREKGKSIDMTDLKDNSVVMFQHKYYYYLEFFIGLVIPTMVPMYYFGESFTNAFFGCTVYYYIITVNIIWGLNSVSHKIGLKPYNRSIKATENLTMMFIAMGEGFHNYHHKFPMDYKACELKFDFRNPTTIFINGFAKLGLVSDLKEIPAYIVAKEMEKNGDGSTVKPSNKTYFGIKESFFYHTYVFVVFIIYLCYIL